MSFENNENQIIGQFEALFDEKRIFGDERDLEMCRVYKNDAGNNCTIPIRVPYMYPEMKQDPRNKIMLSPECVKESIETFIKTRIRNSTKSVILFRIDITNTNDFDLDNNALIMMKNYYEIKEARRTDPEKANKIENRINENKKLIFKLRDGLITEKEFEKEMSKRNQEYMPKPIEDHDDRIKEIQHNEGLIRQHIEKYIGKIGYSFHYPGVGSIPVNIHIVHPSSKNNYGAIITSGMSYLSAYPPQGYEHLKHTELLVKVPPDWPLPKNEVKKDEYSWLIEELLSFPDYIQSSHQWFFDGHTFGNGNPPKPFTKNTQLCGFLFTLPFLSFPAEFCELKINDFKTVYFLQLLPLYKEEMDYVVQNGHEVFLEKLSEKNNPDHVDLKRRNLFSDLKMMDGYPGTLGNWCPNCHTVIRNVKPGKKKVKCHVCRYTVTLK